MSEVEIRGPFGGFMHDPKFDEWLKDWRREENRERYQAKKKFDRRMSDKNHRGLMKL